MIFLSEQKISEICIQNVVSGADVLIAVVSYSVCSQCGMSIMMDTDPKMLVAAE